MAKAYGPGVYSYQKDEPLEDGEHRIAVRVQGMYGLWSNWSETTILVQNNPGNTIRLSGIFDIDAHLIWTIGNDDPDASVNVYRDGKWIAKLLNDLDYTDCLSLGDHSYYVELWQTDGNYVRSNTVAGTIDTEETLIAEVGDYNWQKINLSETSDHRNGFSWSREYAVRPVLGSNYPVYELGKAITLSGNYSCSFSDDAEAERFEKLKGKTVVVKSKRKKLIAGIMVGLDISPAEFFTTYTFSLQQISLEEFFTDETGT